MPARNAPISYRLAIHLDGVVRRVLPVPATQLTIGRAPENELVLEDALVSRQHARLYHQHGRLWFEDLDSVHGTKLNGEASPRSALSTGDALTIGPFQLVVQQLAPGEAPAAGASGPTVIARAAAAAPAAGQELAVLLAVLESLDTHLPREVLLERILSGLRIALDGERAFLYRPSPRKKTVERITAVLAADADAALPVSETLVLRVAREREPVLFTDLVGLEGQGQESLVRLATSHVQSIVVAPLESGTRLVGVLYVDSRGSRRSFTAADLDMLGRATRYLAGVVDGIEVRHELTDENKRLREIVGGRTAHDVPLDKLCAPGGAMAKALALVHKAAASDVTVLLSGETGSGKEETARLLHRLSARRGGPFIAINCGAIPDTLVESELFGYRKGAFSGANEDRSGLVELAGGGTLFLDEVGELPLSAQVKLLRVIEERQVQRLGSSEPIAVDFRLVAATHRDVAAQVAAGTFRQDLLYRLKVFPLDLPALRERKEDLPLLVDWLVQSLARRTGNRAKRPAPELAGALAAYEWPGNIRELRNVLERALVIEESDELTPSSLPPEILRYAAEAPAEVAPGEPPAGAAPVRSYAEELKEFDRAYLKRLQRAVGNNVSAMSRLSGLTRLTIYRKLGSLTLQDEEPPGGADRSSDKSG